MIISAGFDAHKRDPLANLRLVEARFRLGHRARSMEVADKHAQGRLVSVLEGGYDLEAPVEIGGRPCHGVDATADA